MKHFKILITQANLSIDYIIQTFFCLFIKKNLIFFVIKKEVAAEHLLLVDFLPNFFPVQGFLITGFYNKKFLLQKPTTYIGTTAQEGVSSSFLAFLIGGKKDICYLIMSDKTRNLLFNNPIVLKAQTLSDIITLSSLPL